MIFLEDFDEEDKMSNIVTGLPVEEGTKPKTATAANLKDGVTSRLICEDPFETMRSFAKRGKGPCMIAAEDRSASEREFIKEEEANKETEEKKKKEKLMEEKI
jgi:hypothetical protein